MFHRFQDRFGTAGLVIACIALIAALGGTALAAGGLTKSQEKQVTKIAKKYAGKPGAAGANGSNGSPGARGDAGTAGSNGTNGTNGAPGESVAISAAGAECPSGGTKFTNKTGTGKACNGTTGFTEFLPSEQTETGAWGAYSPDGSGVYTPISFNIPLEAGLDGSHVHFIAEGDPAPAGCTGGTPATPTAEPGNLCIYVAEQLELSSALIRNPTTGEFGSAGSTGVILIPIVEPTGSAYGTWAVTAE